jgi:hypothetical protein
MDLLDIAIRFKQVSERASLAGNYEVASATSRVASDLVNGDLYVSVDSYLVLLSHYEGGKYGGAV